MNAIANAGPSSAIEPLPVSPTRWIVLAKILRPQGRKGELLAELLTDFPERFGSPESAARVFLAPAGFTGAPEEARQAEVVGFWLPVGKNAGRVVLAFAGIHSITAAKALQRLEVVVPAEERLTLDADAEYIDDLLDSTVFDRGAPIGVVTGVDFPTTPDGTRRLEDAAPLLTVLTPDGVEVLIPYVTAFLVSVDTAAKRIEMNLPEGLVDLNR